jgi:hypothetical protein
MPMTAGRRGTRIMIPKLRTPPHSVGRYYS